MSSPTDIVNMALDSIGCTTTIQSVNPPAPPNSVAAQAASRNYQTQVDAVLRSANWNCTRQQGPLALVAAALGTPENPDGTTLPIPPLPWLYEYAYPADCLKLRFVIPTVATSVNSTPVMTGVGGAYNRRAQTAIPFVPNISQDAGGNDVRTILTNAPNAQAIYTRRIQNPDLWDPQLKTAIIATLAAVLVAPLNMDKALMSQKIQLAVGMITQARIADGNEGITSSDHMPDWMQVRQTGGWYSGNIDGWSGFWGGGWDTIDMCDGVSY